MSIYLRSETDGKVITHTTVNSRPNFYFLTVDGLPFVYAANKSLKPVYDTLLKLDLGRIPSYATVSRWFKIASTDRIEIPCDNHRVFISLEYLDLDNILD